MPWFMSDPWKCHGADSHFIGFTMLIWIDSPLPRSREFLFLDRDGVINEDRPDFITSWEEVRFYPDALDALSWLRELGVQVILVSNQSGLNRGIVHWESFWEIHHRMMDTIRDSGGEILAAFYCPHRPDEHCQCRKPKPGMILEASKLYGILPGTCTMIGDRLTDLDAAAQAGCRGVLLDRAGSAVASSENDCSTGNEKVPRYSNLYEAVSELWLPKGR